MKITDWNELSDAKRAELISLAMFQCTAIPRAIESIGSKVKKNPKGLERLIIFRSLALTAAGVAGLYGTVE